jgi:uncharacterized membrane protein YheB (UPF0754 family)
MSNDDMMLKLPTEIVERAVRDKISAAIASQLGNPEKMIQQLVASALSQKVDSRGVVSKSSYENKHEFLEVMMGNFIRDAAKEALTEYMNENRQKIKEAVKKDIAKSSSKLAKVFVDGMVDSIGCNYSTKLDVSFRSHRDD